MILFSTKNYEYLKEKLLRIGGFENGEIERKNFPDGEIYRKVKSSVRNKDVVILGGTITDADIFEIYALGCAISNFEAKSISFLIPYYGYSTMERAVQEGEVVTAKVVARLLSGVPKAYQGNTVYLLDLHADQTLHYFEGDTKRHHITAKNEILSHIKSLSLTDFVMASADQGRAKQVQKLADALQVDSAFVTKRRYYDGRVVAQAANSDVSGRSVVIYDDMIRSGSSILEAIKVYEDAGAKEIFIYTTHGVFCSEAKTKLAAKDIVKKIVYTDSCPQKELISEKEEQISLAKLLVEEIKG